MTKKIELYFMPEEVMLVIEYPSGVVYTNQVGHQACMQPELEGVLAPLQLGQPVGDAMTRLFDAYSPYGIEGLDEAGADTIDAILASNAWTDGIKVDRKRLRECWEEWVYVTLDPSSGAPSWSGFAPGTRGVLTWRGRPA